MVEGSERRNKADAKTHAQWRVKTNAMNTTKQPTWEQKQRSMGSNRQRALPRTHAHTRVIQAKVKVSELTASACPVPRYYLLWLKPLGQKKPIDTLRFCIQLGR